MGKYIKTPELSTSFTGDGKKAKKRFENIFDGKVKKFGYIPLTAAIVCAFGFGAVISLGDKDKHEPVTVLVIGEDESGRADSLLLGTLDEKLSITQIPRHTYLPDGVKIYNVPDTDIAAKAAEIAGVDIDGYVRMTSDGFSDIIDTLGGIDFNVPVDMYYEDPYKGLLIDLDAGDRTLTGDEAEMLVRYRRGMADEMGKYEGYENGDIDRLGVQREFLYAVADKLLHDGVSGETVSAMITDTETDIPAERAAELIKRMSELEVGDVEISLLEGDIRKTAEGIFYVPKAYKE